MAHRILVCGSREWADYDCISDTLYEHQPMVLAHGAARGADRLAGQWAAKNNVPVKEYPANWDGEGRGAGFARNQRMLDQFQPHLVIAFKDALDPTLTIGGTEHMVKIAREAGYEVLVVDRYTRLGLFDA